MRFLKFVGGVFFVLLIFLLFLAFFIKDSAETQQSIYIKASPQSVFRMVNNLHNWKEWSPFMTGDNDLNSVFNGPQLGVGSKHSWTGKNGRRGSQEIIQSVPYQLVLIELDMGGSGKAFDEWSFRDTTGGVVVNWKLGMTDLSYPFHRYFGYFIEGTMKPLQEKGLQRLKEIAENSPASNYVEIVDRETHRAVAILDSAMMPLVESKMAENFRMLKKSMHAGRLAPSGPAFAVFYNWDADAPVKFRVAYPVEEEVREHEAMRQYIWEGGKMLKAVHAGSSDGLVKVHQDIDAFMADFGLKLRGTGVYEVYLNAPMDHGDSSAVVTEVYYPVE